MGFTCSFNCKKNKGGKLIKFIKIILINIFIFSLLIFISDIFTYKYYANILKNKRNYGIDKFGYNIRLPIYTNDLKSFFNGRGNIYWGRKPDGLEYKNKIPIVVFGCSFAYGQYLNFNQTFSYKLAHLLKRPVYNRSIVGGGFQHMYFQTVDYGNKDYFNDIKDTDIVIYIMINDHYRRTILNYFNIPDKDILLTYSYKNSKFKMNDNKFFNLLKSSYTFKSLNRIYADNYVLNPNHAEILTDTAVRYFELTRNELEKHYNKHIKFCIILYESWEIPHNKLLTKKLQDKGFIVISTKDLTNEDLNSPKYMLQDNLHPTEAAWDLLTPLIAKKIKEES